MPDPASLVVGATATLTLTLNAPQLEYTVVPVAILPGGILSAPKKVPDCMPWIPWDSPVEVRPRERAARPGSSREVPRET